MEYPAKGLIGVVFILAVAGGIMKYAEVRESRGAAAKIRAEAVVPRKSDQEIKEMKISIAQNETGAILSSMGRSIGRGGISGR